MPTHEVLGGKVQLYRKPKSRFWWVASTVGGDRRRVSTKEENLVLAKEFAEDWFLELRGKSRAGVLTRREPSFDDMADLFEAEYELITEGERSPKWVQGHKDRLRLHLRPFFKGMAITDIDSGKAQSYRLHRAKQFGRLPAKGPEGEYVRPPKPPSRSTIHDEIGTLSLVLQTAYRHRKIHGVPDLSPPYRQQKKIIHRPWFTLAEYKQLYKAVAKAAREAPERYRYAYEQLYDQILILGNTGLRPDEATRLQHRDVTIAHDRDTGQKILEIEVRGKTGYGPCKSMPAAVKHYERLLARPKQAPSGRAKDRKRYEQLAAMKLEAGKLSPVRQKQLDALAPLFGENGAFNNLEYAKPTDLLFPSNHTDIFNDILVKEGLKYDREGHPRVLYSLRHTYICLRLLDGADIYQLAKNCRTSVEMIEKHYAIHLKNVIDAGAINVRKTRRRSRPDTSTFTELSDGE